MEGARILPKERDLLAERLLYTLLRYRRSWESRRGKFHQPTIYLGNGLCRAFHPLPRRGF